MAAHTIALQPFELPTPMAVFACNALVFADEREARFAMIKHAATGKRVLIVAIGTTLFAKFSFMRICVAIAAR